MATRGRRKSELTLLERLLEKIEINSVTDCWEYQGGKNNLGYGMIRDEDKMRTTHRVSYEEHNNLKIPTGMCVCHACDNPMCVNPSHLWLGTRTQNTRDMLTKGRGKPWGGIGMTGKRQPKTMCSLCNTEYANNTFTRHVRACQQRNSINRLSTN
jgi:hypothetical protein